MKKTVIAGIAALTLGLASVGIGTGVALTQPAPVAVVEQATVVEEIQPTVTPTPIETPTATPTPEPVVEAPAPPPGPVKCPEGTTAGQVDAEGNESLCAATGPQGQQCAEYNGNECTSWLKP